MVIRVKKKNIRIRVICGFNIYFDTALFCVSQINKDIKNTDRAAKSV